MLSSLGRECFSDQLVACSDRCGATELICRCGEQCADDACCMVIGSLKQLHAFDLDRCDVVICGISLPDGSGLDALAFIRGLRPDLGVIIMGENEGDPTVAVEAIRAGALDFLEATSTDIRALPRALEKCLVHQRIKQENERLQLDLSKSLREVGLKNQQLRIAVDQLEAMAKMDDLTGLNNRRWLGEELDRTWAQALRNNVPIAFMMIDLDRFKAINDHYGHQHGDELLQQAARIIKANCRDVDLTARYGGDEFCVLMPNTQAHEAIDVARRILREYEIVNQKRTTGHPVISMSIGIAHVDLSCPANAQQLIHHADEAMYAAKSSPTCQAMIRDVKGVYPAITNHSATSSKQADRPTK
ncbi:MAG: diguanylate cyclase [Planctomycetes bacterium]|nr:diguanylate cyclase [Planctomycetota bacterium]